jgi:hypothetical protein
MPYAKTSLRKQKRDLRERMQAQGLDYRDIAVEFSRHYNLRPRAAWREAYGWSLQQTADRINEFRGHVGLDSGGFAGMTAPHLCEHENWPGHGTQPSGRRPTPYLLAVLATVYDCAVTELIDLSDREHFPASDLLILDRYGTSQRATARVCGTPAQPACPAGGSAPLPVLMPVAGGAGIGREVAKAAHAASEHAERAERRDIGDATLEQLRGDVMRLSHDYMAGEPFGLFQEMRRIQDRIQAALDRRLWPRDETDLYLLLGCVNCLMAAVADDLGYPSASEELIRAAWAYALVIGHGPLKAKLRADLASVAHWRNRPRQARDLAEDGLRYLAGGPNAVQLYLKYARAAAKLGNAGVARRAIGKAADARELRNNDDLLQLGGEFAFSQASQHYLAGSTLLEIPDAEHDAITELERATELYRAGPEDGEHHSFELHMLAHIELAAARLRAGDLDGARPALHPVLSLPPAKRIDPLPQRLEMIRSELTRPRYQGSSQAGDLVVEIENFSRDTIASALSALRLAALPA